MHLERECSGPNIDEYAVYDHLILRLMSKLLIYIKLLLVISINYNWLALG
jgi:hypothetical protein